MVSGLFTLHTIRDPDTRKDIGSIRTGDPRTPTRILDINPPDTMPGHIHLYPGTSVPRLAAFLGAWVHGGRPAHITINCFLQGDTNSVTFSVETNPDAASAWVYANVGHKRGSVPWLKREAAQKLFIYLTEWMEQEDDPHWRRPIGAHRSEEEYQLYENPRYHWREDDPDDEE